MIRWEPNNKIKQAKEKLEKYYIQYSAINKTKYNDYLYSPGQVLCFTSPGPGIIMPLLNAVIIISRRVLFSIL